MQHVPCTISSAQNCESIVCNPSNQMLIPGIWQANFEHLLCMQTHARWRASLTVQVFLQAETQIKSHEGLRAAGRVSLHTGGVDMCNVKGNWAILRPNETVLYAPSVPISHGLCLRCISRSFRLAGWPAESESDKSSWKQCILSVGVQKSETTLTCCLIRDYLI